MKIETKYNIGDIVKIVPFECVGEIISIWIKRRYPLYEVEFYLECNKKTEYISERDLDDKDA